MSDAADPTPIAPDALTVPQPVAHTLARAESLVRDAADVAGRIAATATLDPTAQLHPDSRVGPGASLGAEAQLDSGARVGAHAHVGAAVVIGADTHLGERVTVGDGSVIGPASYIGSGSRLGTGVRIGRRVFLEPNVTIGDGATIHDHAAVTTGVTLPAHVSVAAARVCTASPTPSPVTLSAAEADAVLAVLRAETAASHGLGWDAVEFAAELTLAMAPIRAVLTGDPLGVPTLASRDASEDSAYSLLGLLAARTLTLLSEGRVPSVGRRDASGFDPRLQLAAAATRLRLHLLDTALDAVPTYDRVGRLEHATTELAASALHLQPTDRPPHIPPPVTPGDAARLLDTALAPALAAAEAGVPALAVAQDLVARCADALAGATAYDEPAVLELLGLDAARCVAALLQPDVCPPVVGGDRASTDLHMLLSLPVYPSPRRPTAYAVAAPPVGTARSRLALALTERGDRHLRDEALAVVLGLDTALSALLDRCGWRDGGRLTLRAAQHGAYIHLGPREVCAQVRRLYDLTGGPVAVGWPAASADPVNTADGDDAFVQAHPVAAGLAGMRTQLAPHALTGEIAPHAAPRRATSPVSRRPTPHDLRATVTETVGRLLRRGAVTR